MRVIVIDADKKTVEEVEVDGKHTYDELKRLLNGAWLEAVAMADGEYLYVDEEFLLKPDAKTATEWFIVRPAGPIVGHPQPMRPIGVLAGIGADGDTVATRLTLEQVRASVQFVRKTYQGFTVTEGKTELLGKPAFLIERHAHFSDLPPDPKPHPLSLGAVLDHKRRR